ncbi:nuclear transport factor 2 family protein [Glaciecola sp. MH2013]|uniref:nuclear transport factor 2 family protein n=1 Tax=Glaciecola sp. MH2013 TaxID=2785524 RepID=UPI00189CBCC2|nr:nuclear transport factor 2 family protein [Glaciecola sp. MH2013]MBF7074696.1 nuclear transport factor 2 family protein [Glaciecola sp. MH2013]
MQAIKKFERFYTDLASMQLDALPDLYSKEVVFIDPIAEHRGIEALVNYFSRLLENAKYCTFSIQSIKQAGDKNHVVTWQMRFSSSKMNKGKPIEVDGITLLEIEDNKVTYHRDYYDLGQMIYDNVPLLGWVTRRIKKSMSK